MGIDRINWDIMELTKQQDGYNSSIRMAECLSNHCDLSICDINIIFVPNSDVKRAVNNILICHSISKLDINITPCLFARK